MNAYFARYIEELFPPILFRLYRRYLKKAGYFGSYGSWAEASSASGGYDTREILDRVKRALAQVRDGEVPYERDGVVFPQIHHAWPLLAGLLWAASQTGNRLRVMDVGGSLGSSYFQNRGFLTHLREFRWSVVEQRNFVQCGKEEFSDAMLNFYEDLKACAETENPSVVLLSSVLPYLESPYELLEQIMALSIPFVIVDRTPMLAGHLDRLTVQKVPPEIYPASYPAWIFGRRKFLALLDTKYEMIAEFDALAGSIHMGDMVAFDRGFIFRIRK